MFNSLFYSLLFILLFTLCSCLQHLRRIAFLKVLVFSKTTDPQPSILLKEKSHRTVLSHLFLKALKIFKQTQKNCYCSMNCISTLFVINDFSLTTFIFSALLLFIFIVMFLSACFKNLQSIAVISKVLTQSMVCHG